MPKRVTVFRLSQRILQQEEQASKITKAQSFPELNTYSLCESCSFLGAEPGPACVLLFHVVKLSVSVYLTFEGATCTVSKDWQRSGYIQQWISGNFNFPKCLILVEDGTFYSVLLPLGGVVCKKGPQKWLFQTILRRSMWFGFFFVKKKNREDRMAKKPEQNSR